MRNTVIGLIVILIIVGIGWWFYQQNGSPVVTNFDECVAAGNPVQESYPRQCLTADGQTFTEPVASSTPLADGQYEISAADSQLIWAGSKTFVKDYTDRGTIAVKSGEIGIASGAVATGTLVIDMTSIVSEETTNESAAIAKLTEHLKSDDFFGVAKYPTATFRLTGALPGAAANQYVLAGDLTIRGVTKPIEIPATITQTGDTLQVVGEATVDRSLYGVKFGSTSFFKELADEAIVDNMFKLNFSLKATQMTPAKTDQPATTTPAAE